MSLRDAVEVTAKRGQYMQDAVPEGEGMMAAILGLERGRVLEICLSITDGYVAPANYNCPGQIVVAGQKHAVKEAMRRAEEAGAKKALSLAVSVPSHCELMKPVSKKLAELFDNIKFKPASFPIINNADARPLTNPQEIWLSLIRQLNEPLLWEESIKWMIENGVDTFIEVGPRKVLSGLIKRIDGNVRVCNVEDIKTLEETLKIIKE
jgi:[acyl-carrier-protein] S-malonyltransferase